MEIAAAKPAVDPRRYFESVRTDSVVPEHAAGLPLSGDHQPLQSVVHHLPAHL